MRDNLITLSGFKMMIKGYVKEAKEMKLIRIDGNKIYITDWDITDLMFYSDELKTDVSYELYLNDTYTGDVMATTELFIDEEDSKVTRNVCFIPVKPLNRIIIDFSIN